MTGHLLGAALLLLSVNSLSADVFSFSYSGPGGISASGKITATPTGGGVYSMTGITGTRDGVQMSYSPVGTGTFFYGGSAASSLGAIAFSLNSIFSFDTVSFAGGSYHETVAGFQNSSTTLSTLSLTRLPEPSTILLLLTMGLGVFAVGRKLPGNKTS
jgi:hypothetical protein